MKVYLAGMYSDKHWIRKHAEELRAAGQVVTSSWLEEPHSPDITMDQVDPRKLMWYAEDDLWDIRRADTLVFFSLDPQTASVRGGRHVEFGYALALGKTIVVVGPRENIFHHLPTIHHFETWTAAYDWLV